MAEKPIILFDGVCNFCNAGVNFVIRQDKKNIFRFAALQSGTGRRLAEQYDLPKKDFDSFILIENDKVYNRSSAGLKVFNRLPWYWKWTQLFSIVPKTVRDAMYDFIARKRYKWFGKKEECMIPTPEVHNRFLN
jgi:predicted DCC family thiol-disulfide oxidoreductase YuxK